MSAPPNRERDESDLRWFWCHAEGELGYCGSGDFERAAQVVTVPTPRCPACSRGPELAVFDAAGRRARRAKCSACRGLGVVVPSTYTSGNAPAAAAEESPWMALMRRGDDPVLSAREPGWMGLVGPMATARRRHRVVRLALRAIESGHVRVLHAVYGPAPRAMPDDAPEGALILAALNRALPERAREILLRRLRAGSRDRFAQGAGRRQVDMWLAGSWRAYDRARGRVVDEEREPIVEALAESDRLLAASARLLEMARAEVPDLAKSERPSGVYDAIVQIDITDERIAVT